VFILWQFLCLKKAANFNVIANEHYEEVFAVVHLGGQMYDSGHLFPHPTPKIERSELSQLFTALWVGTGPFS